jgi:SagB-type dehydrogenase family enzyme
MRPPWEPPRLAHMYPATMLYLENSVLNPARERICREDILTFSAHVQGNDASLGKSYPLCPGTPLPGPSILRNATERVIGRRRTRRNFTGKGIGLRKLARILHCAYGVTSRNSGRTNAPAFRACPSAGALYPLEIYPIVLNSRDLHKGLYHYNVQKHSLERLSKANSYDQLDKNLFGAELMPRADVALVITAVLERTLRKYGERGYRFILIEVGHMAQNVSLVCESLDLNSVCLGGFYEDGLAKLLSIEPRLESVQYIVLIGTR